jgi:Spy/CpxP family protein refolding chaperone
MRYSKTGWTMVAALVIVSMVSQVSLAQREEGRRGRGGPGGAPSAARLLAIKEVQTALKLTDDQTSKLEKINEEARDEIRKAMQDGGDRAKMQELTAATTKKVNEVLDEGQQKRLLGIFVQVAGAGAINDPTIAKELNLTEDQKKQLEEARDKNREAMREVLDGARDGDREAVREKLEKFREESNKKLLAVLTSDQQAQLEAMKGEKVEIDMSALRGGPGGRGGDRPRGERGDRGGRGRDRNPESKSEEKSSN